MHFIEALVDTCFIEDQYKNTLKLSFIRDIPFQQPFPAMSIEKEVFELLHKLSSKCVYMKPQLEISLARLAAWGGKSSPKDTPLWDDMCLFTMCRRIGTSGDKDLLDQFSAKYDFAKSATSEQWNVSAEDIHDECGLAYFECKCYDCPLCRQHIDWCACDAIVSGIGRELTAMRI